MTHSQTYFGFRSNSFSVFVDLFFAISGYVIAFLYADRLASWPDYRAFIWRRIARLGPLHWATLATFIALGAIAPLVGYSVNNQEVFDASCIPANAALIHATNLCPHYSFNGPSWSISAEMMMYLAAPVFFALTRRPGAAALTLGGVWIMLTVTAGTDWLKWTFEWGAIRAVPSFLLGAVLCFNRERLRGLPGAGALFGLGLVSLFAGALLGLPTILLLALAYLTLVGGIAGDLSGKTSGIVERIAPFGLLSYAIYMLHMLVLTAANFAAASLGLTGAARTIVMGGAVLAVLPLSYLSYLFFETPCRRWLTARRSAYPAQAIPLAQHN